MTGDLRRDILGAKENNLAGAGLYGFENRKELMQAGAARIVSTVTE